MPLFPFGGIDSRLFFFYRTFPPAIYQLLFGVLLAGCLLSSLSLTEDSKHLALRNVLSFRSASRNTAGLAVRKFSQARYVPLLSPVQFLGLDRSASRDGTVYQLPVVRTCIVATCCELGLPFGASLL